MDPEPAKSTWRLPLSPVGFSLGLKMCSWAGRLTKHGFASRVSTNMGSGTPRRKANSRDGAHAASKHYLCVLWVFLVQGITPWTDVQGTWGDWWLLPAATPAWVMHSTACSPACCSSRSFPEMPVDKPMESPLRLSRHQPCCSPPEISFVVEVGSVPWGGVICVENIIVK